MIICLQVCPSRNGENNYYVIYTLHAMELKTYKYIERKLKRCLDDFLPNENIYKREIFG